MFVDIIKGFKLFILARVDLAANFVKISDLRVKVTFSQMIEPVLKWLLMSEGHNWFILANWSPTFAERLWNFMQL